MAVFTDADFAAMRRMFLNDPASKQEYLNSGLNKQEWKDAMQGLEDWFEGSRTAQKSAIDTAVGQTLANPLAKKIGRVYYQWKWNGE